MKRIILLASFLACFAVSALSQGAPPWTIQEVDGSPRVNSPTLIRITNGQLSCTGKTCTITVSGGSGSPGGASGTVQWNDGGAFGGTSGLTATSSTVTIVSGVSGTFSRAGNLLTLTNTTDSSSVQAALLQGDRATVSANDEAYQTLRLSNAAGTQTEVARLTWAIPTATAASENGRLDFSVMTGGALAKELQLAGADLSPSTSDGLALGTGSLMWSDLFLASGAVINFNNGDVTVTHSSDLLTIAGGNVIISSPGTAAGSVDTIDGTQTLTNKTITSALNTLGSVTVNMTGTDADGDIYYNSSNTLTRLGIGTASQCLKTNAGATAPEWGACGGGAVSLTVGSTAIASGSAGRFLYETSGNVLGEISTLTTDGTILTFSPTVTTGTGATSGLNANANSLTTGDAFNFASSSVTSGNVFKISAAGTAAASNTKTALNVSTSGANATNAMTTFGAVISNTSTNATSGTNVALQLTASGATTANTALNITAGSLATAGTIVQTSTSATSFTSGANGATTPTFTIDNSTASQASGITVAGKADGTAPTLTVNSRTQTTTALAGNGLAITADPAIAGSSVAGAAAGGAVTITSGAAARLTSGNANGGNINLVTGAGIGSGVQGQVNLGGSTSSFPGFGWSGTNVALLLADGSNYAAGLAVLRLGLNGSAGSIVFNTSGFGTGGDLTLRRSAAANLAFGAADAASPVAQATSVQNGTGTNTSGATWTHQGSLGTSQGTPGRLAFNAGALIAASGTTQQTAVSRLELGATKVVANNTATTLVNVTNAANTSAGGVIDYTVEVFDGTDVQIEVGSVSYMVTNKGGVFSGNTATKFGNAQNMTSGTLTVTWAISGANPALLSVNANSSLTPSTGYPRISYNVRSLSQQAIAVQ